MKILDVSLREDPIKEIAWRQAFRRAYLGWEWLSLCREYQQYRNDRTVLGRAEELFVEAKQILREWGMGHMNSELEQLIDESLEEIARLYHAES